MAEYSINHFHTAQNFTKLIFYIGYESIHEEVKLLRKQKNYYAA